MLPLCYAAPPPHLFQSLLVYEIITGKGLLSRPRTMMFGTDVSACQWYCSPTHSAGLLTLHAVVVSPMPLHFPLLRSLSQQAVSQRFSNFLIKKKAFITIEAFLGNPTERLFLRRSLLEKSFVCHPNNDSQIKVSKQTKNGKFIQRKNPQNR